MLNDPVSGDSRVLDLITGTVHSTASVKGTVRLGTDGRFGHFHTARSTHLIDSGAWTVDHGDHVHYYRAAIRELGDIPGGSEARMHGDSAVTAVTDGEGRALLYDRDELEDGRIGSPRTLPGTHAGPVLPYAEHLLTFTERDGTTRLAVLDREGDPVESPRAACDRPRGAAVTGRGAVLGCADGVLLVGERDGAFTAEKISYGEDVPAAQRAVGFRQRPGSDTLTAPAGTDAVWVLDVTERTWTRVETGPVVAVGTAGEGSPLLVLETDGALHGYDIGSGEEVARTEPLLTGEHRAGTDGGPVIEVDRNRSYLNDPRGRRVYEIDHDDDLRVARTFDVDIEPHLMAETGW
ncbi:lipoprotein [Streptomyces chumphonensis]